MNALRGTTHPSTRRAPINPRDMFARHASRAARRVASASNLAVSSPDSAANAWRTSPPAAAVRPWRTLGATMATLPFAVEAGSAAAGYTGGLLNPADLKRIAHDLSAMPRKRIEGPDVPQARAVLVPLCHDSRTKVPHALFTVKPDDFGAPHAGFPGGPRHNDDSDDIGAAVREAIRELGLGDGASLRILGVGSDAADVPKQCAVTPVVGYLGELDVEEMTSMSALESSRKHTLMAVRLDDLLSKESVDVTLVPGVGPMPVFNAGAGEEEKGDGRRGGGLKIWGLSAQILHQVMRVVVGPRKEYMEALYGPFVNKKFVGGNSNP